MIQMRRELKTPGTTQQQVNDDGTVVNLFCVKVEMSSQAVRVFWAFSSRGEKRQIPVASNIPVKRVERIEEDEEEPIYC